MSRPNSDLTQLVHDHMDQWQARGRADARAVIAAHPELRDEKSLFMNLALTEYALRKEAGERLSRHEFCDQFPEYRESLVQLLEVDDQFDRCPQLSPRDAAELWPKAGDSFLGYEIIEPLGRGGLARVFLAREPLVGDRLVVLKVSTYSAHEAHTLGKLDHPSIVPIYSVHDDELSGLSAICMPFLGLATGIDAIDAAFGRAGREPDGQLLSRVARDARPLAPLPPLPAECNFSAARKSYAEAVCQLGLELAEALAAAHARGIVHRDIKPSNILLAYSGRAMLLDFNLSTGGQQQTLQIGGTLAYMAPECIQSLQRGGQQPAPAFAPAGDVYSLGAVLYQLLTGQLPHGAGQPPLPPDDYEGWLACKQHTPPPNRRYLMDAGLAAIVFKCLAVQPAARYPSAAALATDLRAYLSTPAQLARFGRRHRRQLLMAGVAATAGAVGLAAFIGSQPSPLDALYQQGLADYDAREYDKAANRFTHCLELKPGWHPALFARAQSLRALGKFREARNDYLGLKDADPAWAYSFAGYCNMRVNDYSGAWFDFTNAEKAGLEDVPSLLNFSLVNRRRGRSADAAALCTRVLTIDPANMQALRERATMLLALSINTKDKRPDSQALTDAKNYCRLESSYDSACFCAYVHAEAALKDAAVEAEAIHYFTVALERGLPSVRLHKLPPSMKRLLVFVDAALVNEAPTTADFTVVNNFIELPTTADWLAFSTAHRQRQALIAARQ